MRKSDWWIVPAMIAGIKLTFILGITFWLLHDVLVYGRAVEFDAEELKMALFLGVVTVFGVIVLVVSTMMLESKTARNIVGWCAFGAAILNALMASVIWTDPSDGASIGMTSATILFAAFASFCLIVPMDMGSETPDPNGATSKT